MDELDLRSISGVLGICDADYDRVTGKRLRANVVHADLHDAEMMIVHSPAFRNVHAELYEAVVGDGAFQASRDTLLNIAADIGAVRLWNEENKLNLTFRSVSAGDFLGPNREFEYAGYIGSLIEASPSGCPSSAEVMRVVEQRRSDVADGELACGHDFSSLLDVDAAYSADREAYGVEVVEKMLRLAFDDASFGGTHLVRDLQSWEDQSGLEVLESTFDD